MAPSGTCDQMRPRKISRKFRTAAVLSTLSACATLIMIGYAVHGFQTDLLSKLDGQNFSLVEVGSFSGMRVLHFGSAWFESRKPLVGSLLIGVSEEGDRLLISTNTGYAGHRDDRNEPTR